MALGASVSVEEYLSTTYHPDCEYADGELIERNVGEFDHSGLQLIIALALQKQARQARAYVFPGLRIQIAPRRFLIPDILVTTKKGRGRILREPPFLCVEILSPEDRFSRVEAKIDEYLAFGVPHVWEVDPAARKAWTYTKDGRRGAATHLSTTAPDLSLQLSDLFAELDDCVERG